MLVFVFSPLVIVEDVEGITGEDKEMLGDGRECGGEGEDARPGGEMFEEKFEKSHSVQHWLLSGGEKSRFSPLKRVVEV